MNRRAVLTVGIAACALAVALVAVLVVAASGSGVVSGAGASTPQAVTGALLSAIERDDIPGVNRQFCAADRRNGAASIMRTDQLRSFTIGDATPSTNGTVMVRVTLVERGANATIRLPVVREGGQWKVCLSRLGATSSTPPSTTPPPMSTAPLPTLPPNFQCASNITGFETAESYIDLTEFGSGYAAAQACVWRHSVPLRVTRLIGRGHPFYQTDDNSGTGPVVHYHSPLRDVVVTISRKPDGYFYVTDVKIHSH